MKGYVIAFEVLNCDVNCLDGSLIPRPPSRTGKAISSLIELIKASWPIKACYIRVYTLYTYVILN